MWRRGVKQFEAYFRDGHKNYWYCQLFIGRLTPESSHALQPEVYCAQILIVNGVRNLKLAPTIVLEIK